MTLLEFRIHPLRVAFVGRVFQRVIADDRGIDIEQQTLFDDELDAEKEICPDIGTRLVLIEGLIKLGIIICLTERCVSGTSRGWLNCLIEESNGRDRGNEVAATIDIDVAK